MGKIRLSKEIFRDKVYGCWLGKTIGGTLGMPYEGKKYVHDLSFYRPVPKEPVPNDDLDFQLVWLKMLEDNPDEINFSNFSRYWLKYLSQHWYAEYSFCTYNLRRGLKPPISGSFQNYFVDEMGSPIRSEIWACVAPADPQLAAKMAWMDSCLDHTGGEGRWGEMFWSAVESAAFVIKDIKRLINIGLSMIPISSNIYRVIKEVLYCHENGMSWDEVRERISTIFGHHQVCNAIPNHGFMIIGLLYGKDFGDKLCKAVNCGYDTDCTGATLGSLLGIINGASMIPKEWKEPVGELIVPCKQTITEGLPKTIGELVERTVNVAYDFISKKSKTVEFADKNFVPENVISLLHRNEEVMNLLNFDDHSAIENIGDIEVIFHYGGEPVLYPGIKRVCKVSLMRGGEVIKAEIELKGPPGWRISRPVFMNNQYRFEILADDVKGENKIEIFVKINNTIKRVDFTILSPWDVKPIFATDPAPEK